MGRCIVVTNTVYILFCSRILRHLYVCLMNKQKEREGLIKLMVTCLLFPYDIQQSFTNLLNKVNVLQHDNY